MSRSLVGAYVRAWKVGWREGLTETTRLVHRGVYHAVWPLPVAHADGLGDCGSLALSNRPC